jgi:hypothetical protein
LKIELEGRAIFFVNFLIYALDRNGKRSKIVVSQSRDGLPDSREGSRSPTGMGVKLRRQFPGMLRPGMIGVSKP